MTCNNTVIGPTSTHTCWGWFVYGKFNKNGTGYNRGITYWSIRRNKGSNGCYRSIGVTSIMNKSWIENYTDQWRHEGYFSYLEGYPRYWKTGETATVKLDCNKWKVTYFIDNVQVKQDDIPSNRTYYFAVSICVNKKEYQIVK